MTKKISQLPAATAVDTDDEFVINQNGTTKKVTTANSWQLANVNIDGGNIDGTAIGSASASSGAFTTLTASDDVNFDSGTLFVDASADSVGVGTTAPFTKLQVSQANAKSATGAWQMLSFDTTSQTTGVGGGVTFGGFKTGTSAAEFFAAIDGYKENSTAGNAAGALRLHTQVAGGTGLVERMRIDSSGNVGIGTTSPSQKLQVNGNIRLGSTATTEENAEFQITSGGEIAIHANNAATQDGLFVGAKVLAGVNPNKSFINVFGSSSASFNHIGFGTNDTERMRIDSNGRVLIGGTSALSANAKLETQATSGSCFIRNTSGSLGNDEQALIFNIVGSRQAALSIYKHSGITNPAAYLSLSQEDATSQFYWSDNSGNFRVSTDSYHVGTTSGTVVGTQTSDERIKNIEGIAPYGLSEILQLKPVKYALKSEPDTPRLGFTAQQVRDIIPESVFDTDEDMGEGEPTKLGMEYVQIIPVLVNAIKELKAEIDELKG